MSTHLATCPNCRGEMDVTDVGPYTRVRCPGCGEEVRVKTEMGGYRLTRRIAFGGMSVVYVARDRTLKRKVAVKVLSEEYSADGERERQFEREAKLTAAVSHPNVVRVFTVGRAFGRFFIAMELVSGQSLEERMAVHGALPEKEVIELALQVVDGLRAAKSAGLIHRDIKPGNILIDDKNTAKIVDFGLSLLTAEGGAVRVQEVWATPYYVAPEALEHTEEDHRSDVYALGATLYHALAGVSPIETKDMSTRVLREAKRHVAPLKKVAPWLSSEMVRTVEKAMAHDRRKRFASYDEFRVALETARGMLEARGARFPVHGAVRAQRRERQQLHRKAWLAGAMVLVLFLATAAAFMIAKVRALESEVGEEGGPIPMIVIGSEAGLDPESALEINEAYEGAREALSDDDFVVAEKQFLRVRNHEKSPAQTAAWAGFEAAVAAYLDGRSADARHHLVDLQAILVGKREEDTKLGRRLLGAIDLLVPLAFVPDERIPQVLEDPFRATVLFALALKSWEQGQLERASGMFARLERAGPWAEAEWMRIYQGLGSRYVADYGQMSGADHEVEGKDRAQVEEAIARLDGVYSALRTRGRARFNVKVWQSDLTRRLRYLQSRRVAPEWKELREAAAQQCAAGEFGAAAERIGAAAPGGALEKSQQAALVPLCEAAGGFLRDLQRVLGPGANGVTLRARSGAEFGQVLGSQEGGVLVEDQGAAKSLAWKEIEPDSLLLLHRKLVEATEDAGEKKQRLRQAVGYAWLNGLQAEAGAIARELIALDPGFRVEWNEIVESLGD